jgi:hypothetical protein
MIPLFNAYSNVTQTVRGTFNGTAFDLTASYAVVNVNSTTYEVNMVTTLAGNTIPTTAWFLKDGTVVRLDIAGHNLTKLASTYFQRYFSLWETELEYKQQITSSTSFSFFHSTGTSTVTIGPNTFTVTKYTANSLPETIPGCNGASDTLSTGDFSVGTPSGSSYPLITNIDIAGSRTTVGSSGTPSTTSYSFISQITSVTVA